MFLLCTALKQYTEEAKCSDVFARQAVKFCYASNSNGTLNTRGGGLHSNEIINYPITYFYNIVIGIENQHNSKSSFFKLDSDFVHLLNRCKIVDTVEPNGTRE